MLVCAVMRLNDINHNKQHAVLYRHKNFTFIVTMSSSTFLCKKGNFNSTPYVFTVFVGGSCKRELFSSSLNIVYLLSLFHFVHWKFVSRESAVHSSLKSE